LVSDLIKGGGTDGGTAVCFPFTFGFIRLFAVPKTLFRPLTLCAQIGGSAYRVRFFGGCFGEEVEDVREGIRLSPLTCVLISG
jgi:hypothetical protein